MATRMGLEPTTSAVTGRHSNQLNHRANVSVSDSYIYYHTFCVLARGFFEKILEKVSSVTKKGPFCRVDLCLSTIRNYITLKHMIEQMIFHVRLSTIRNYITLKRDENLQKSVKGLSTIRNHITLKLFLNLHSRMIGLSTIRNHITLKRY